MIAIAALVGECVIINKKKKYEMILSCVVVFLGGFLGGGNMYVFEGWWCN